MTHTKTDNWLLVLDVDRTLLTDDYRLLPSVRDAVQRVRQDGTTVILATARSPRGLEIVLNELGAIDGAICFGGALTLARDGKRLDRDVSSARAVLGPDARPRVIEGARSVGVSLALYAFEEVFVDRLDQRLAREFAHTGDRYAVCDLQSVDEDAFKFLAISRRDETEKLTDLKSRLSGSLSCAFSHGNYLEIGPLGVSKGDALERFARSRGIAPDRVIAIGDGDNDLSMLAFAGHPIAMANATSAVKQAASWATLSNNEGGVAHAIKERVAALLRAPTTDQTEAVCHVDVS